MWETNAASLYSPKRNTDLYQFPIIRDDSTPPADCKPNLISWFIRQKTLLISWKAGYWYSFAVWVQLSNDKAILYVAFIQVYWWIYSLETRNIPSSTMRRPELVIDWLSLSLCGSLDSFFSLFVRDCSLWGVLSTVTFSNSGLSIISIFSLSVGVGCAAFWRASADGMFWWSPTIVNCQC